MGVQRRSCGVSQWRGDCGDFARRARICLRCCSKLKSRFGRERHERWGDRTLDLDLLLFGDAVIDSPTLTVPHPRMSFRRFVLEPAVEIAGDMVHPTIGWTLERLLDQLDCWCGLRGDRVGRRGATQRDWREARDESIRTDRVSPSPMSSVAVGGTTWLAASDSVIVNAIAEAFDPDRHASRRVHAVAGRRCVVPAADGQSVETEVFAAIEAVWPRLGPLGG